MNKPTNAIVDILEYIGETPREGLLNTPQRVIKSYDELYKGYKIKPEDVLKTKFKEKYNQMVILKDIEFYSMCEHHMLPFFGKVSIAYIPNGEVVGISKLARLVEVFSRRLQIQERLTEQIADAINTHLKPQGVAVTIKAKHFCMVARGVNKQNSEMVTNKIHGAFFEEAKARHEFFELLK